MQPMRQRPSIAALLASAPEHLATYRERTAGLTRETKGIRPSEMFFLFAAVADHPPRRIVESGRARGQSTLVLTHCFPQSIIVSLESDATSPDVQVAAARLAGFKNVECRFGDARFLLPSIVGADDVVLIDGPKDFRALKLALRILRRGHARAVFLHDAKLGKPIRQFLDACVPAAFFSDEPAFVSRYRFLDPGRASALPNEITEQARVAYGPTMACLPAEIGNCNLLLARLTLWQWRERIRDTVGKLWGRPAN